MDCMDDMRKAAVVTGASSGIGLAVSSDLMQSGVFTFGISRERSASEFRRWAYVEGEGRGVHLSADISEREQMRNVREVIGERLKSDGRALQCLVVNAGISVRGEFLELTDQEIREVIDVNLYGSIVTLQELVPLMMSGGGSVIIVASCVTDHGMRLRSVYGAAKGGLVSLTKALAIEWGPIGLRVNAVEPGIVVTPLVKEYIERFPERAERARQVTPSGRLGEVSDIVGVVRFLASDDAAHVNGATIRVDGGFTAGSAVW